MVDIRGTISRKYCFYRVILTPFQLIFFSFSSSIHFGWLASSLGSTAHALTVCFSFSSTAFLHCVFFEFPPSPESFPAPLNPPFLFPPLYELLLFTISTTCSSKLSRNSQSVVALPISCLYSLLVDVTLGIFVIFHDVRGFY